MKKLLLLLVITVNFVSAQTFISQYEQLVHVNAQWKNQTNIDGIFKSTPAKQLTEQQLVQLHLQQTELLLRKKDVSHLSPAQKKQREKNLNTLHAYWVNGMFPINDQHANRQPYFIDKHNTYCAVGYLMQQSGADNMAREIHNTQNFSYLLDISHPQLMEWAFNSGLTLDELALIQPGYPDDRPSTITEFHYNNTGADMNEYIEIQQAKGMMYRGATQLLFYNADNILYKRLLLSEMQMFGDYLYSYVFPANESFADSGRVEIISTSAGVDYLCNSIAYGQTAVSIADYSFWQTMPFQTRNYSIGESEGTPVGNSLTFCGNSTGNGITSMVLQSRTATVGALSSCLTTPILLSKLDYSISNKKVNLSWETVSENNNDRFEIEKSSNGADFEKIGIVKGAGTSNSIKQYSFVDEKPFYINQYRLKQIDLDGKFAYSKILYVKVQQSNPLSIAGNPVKKQLQVSISMEPSKIGSLVVYDLMGRRMKTFKGTNGLQSLDIAVLGAGKYLLQLITVDGQAYNQQFIKAD
jgi:hypothetical protein